MTCTWLCTLDLDVLSMAGLETERLLYKSIPCSQLPLKTTEVMYTKGLWFWILFVTGPGQKYPNLLRLPQSSVHFWWNQLLLFSLTALHAMCLNEPEPWAVMPSFLNIRNPITDIMLILRGERRWLLTNSQGMSIREKRLRGAYSIGYNLRPCKNNA